MSQVKVEFHQVDLKKRKLLKAASVGGAALAVAPGIKLFQTAQAKPDEDHPYGDKTGKTFCKHILKSKSALEIIIFILSRTFPTIFLLNLFVLNNPASF